MEWNEAQLSAITEKNKNILVSAAAGSGKTTVLTERICRLVLGDCDIDEMLIVTFTNAAAAEMRKRISEGLNKAMEEAGDDAVRISGQIDKIGSANISTFHAFCFEVVRTFFYLTDVSADFGLCDEVQNSIFSDEAAEEVLDEFFRKERPDFLRFLRRYSKPGDERGIAKMITDLYRHMMSLPEPEKWLNDSVASLESSGDGTDRMTAVDAGVLRDLTLRYSEILFEKKLKVNQIGFDDAQHLALRILDNAEAAAEYRNRFKYIFIDEYQDTNAVQEALVRKIAREDNVFMVGDVKQSIYRFRLADPGIFVDKYKTFSGDSENDVRIDLNSNFRSRPEILNITNTIMEILMTEENCDLAYDENAKLYAGRTEPGGEYGLDPVPVLDVVQRESVKDYLKGRIERELNRPSREQDPVLLSALAGLDEMTDAEMEALVICERIREVLGKTCYDHKKNTEKTVGYGDIVILLRSAKSVAQVYQDVFREAGIPCYVQGGDGYFETAEISVFMNILRVVENRLQDIPLLSVIHSPCFGFSSEEIAQIRLFRRDGLFAEAFLSFALQGMTRENSGEKECGDVSLRQVEELGKQIGIEYGGDKRAALVEKCRNFLKKTDGWREDAGYMPLGDLLWKIADESGYFDYLAGLPMAKKRVDNLKSLFDLAETFRQQTSKGLGGFVNYIEKLSFDNASVDAESGRVDVSGCVRVMTIHKSKGLEFPVVFVAGLGKDFTRSGRNESSDLSLYKDRVLGLRMRSEDGTISVKTQRQLDLEERVRADSIAEEMRLLYVAMTRAKEKLFMIGTAKRDKNGKYLEKIEEDVLKCKTYLEWVYKPMKEEGYAHMVSGVWPDSLDEKGAEEPLEEGEGLAADGAGLTGTAGDSGAGVASAEGSDGLPAGAGGVGAGGPDGVGDGPDDDDGAGIPEFLKDEEPIEYPFGDLVRTQVKFTATELTRRIAEENGVGRLTGFGPPEDPAETGAGAEEAGGTTGDGAAAGEGGFAGTYGTAGKKKSGFTAAERGTITHGVLQNLDLGLYSLGIGVREQIGKMMEAGRLTEAEAEAVNVSSIEFFLGGALGQRLLAADAVYREKEFLLLNRYDKETGSIIQGVIDCFFIEDGKAVIIDYKTDYIPDENRNEVLNNKKEYYGTQLRVYRAAVKEAMGLEVKEMYLCFLGAGVEVRI